VEVVEQRGEVGVENRKRGADSRKWKKRKENAEKEGKKKKRKEEGEEGEEPPACQNLKLRWVYKGEGSELVKWSDDLDAVAANFEFEFKVKKR
jgi:hypothetical protein